MKALLIIGAVVGGYFLLLKVKGNAITAAANTCGTNPNCPALTAAENQWAWVPNPPPFL